MAGTIGRSVAAAGILAIAGAAAGQTTWTVPSGQTPTLAFALNEAVSPVQHGDTIELDGGAVYLQAYVVTHDDLTIRSAPGQQITIDALRQGTVIEQQGQNLRLENLTLTGGRAAVDGGAVRAIARDFTAIGCVFVDNEAPDDAGGIVHSDGVLKLVGCRFENNRTRDTTSASNGGATQTVRTTGLIRGCEFIGNQAGDSGGAIQVSSASMVDIEDSRFEGNSSATQGAGALVFDSASSGLVSHSDFVRNTAVSDGGAVFSASAWPKFLRCRFLENHAGEDGGGLYVSGETAEEVELTSCLVAGNTAVITGAGLMAQNGPHVNCFNCTFVDNVAVEAGGAIMDFGSGAGTQLYSCILRGNAPEQFQNDSPSSYFYCNVQDIAPGFGTQSMDADPMFVDIDGPDDDPMTYEDNDYRLLPGSPSIDAGDSTQVASEYPLDLLLMPRAVDDPSTPDTGVAVFFQTVDQGAFEYQAPAVTPSACPGDLTGDGTTDVFDFAILAEDFGCEDNPD